MRSSVRPMTVTEPDAAAIALDDDERELVLLELEQLVPALQGPRRERFEQLAAATEDGEVPADAVPALQSLLELALQTARARKLYRAEGEKVLTGLYRRTPAGRDLSDQIRDINAALRAVAGKRLTGARVGMRTLGHFTVTLQTDAATVTLAVRPDSLNVESVSVGEGSSG